MGKIKETIPFLPVDGWKTPFHYPIYMVPIKYYPQSKKLKMYWGLGWFYFSCFWVKRGNLERTRWLRHLWLNLITFVFLPYILLNNYLNSNGKSFNIKYIDRRGDLDF